MVKYVDTFDGRNTALNPCPAEPGYAQPLQTLYIQSSWLIQKPPDLDLHCLLLLFIIMYISM